MSGLVEFLKERIDEEAEQAAKCATEGAPTWLSDEPWTWKFTSRGGYQVVEMKAWEREHIARWDPARVLAECAAKRWLVDMGATLAEHDDMGSSTAEEGDAILRHLAQPYSDHPDFDASWLVEEHRG